MDDIENVVQRAANAREIILEKSKPGVGGLLEKFSLDEYLNEFDSSPPLSSYWYVPPHAAGTCLQIRRMSCKALADYHRLALLHLIGCCDRKILQSNIPKSVISLLAENFSRIIKKVQTGPDTYFYHGVDQFSKDLAICRLKLIPCGAEMVDAYSGLPRRLVLVNGRQAVRFTRLWATSGGLTRWYEGHWDRRLMAMFNEDGYNECYLRIAELLKCNPQIRGFISSSWWLDPVLESISPELSFLRRVPEMNGAILLKVGINNDATIDATRYSEVRSELFENGKYTPQVYLLAWPRRELLHWAKSANK